MLCIIQARYSSKRLPGKVLKKILGNTVLQRVVNQVKKSKKISKIIIATSKHKTDKRIINFCNKNKIHCTSGPLNNVFKRFYLSDIANQYDVVVDSKIFKNYKKGASSIIQQCPLNDKTLSFFAYHINDKKIKKNTQLFWCPADNYYEARKS